MEKESSRLRRSGRINSKEKDKNLENLMKAVMLGNKRKGGKLGCGGKAKNNEMTESKSNKIPNEGKIAYLTLNFKKDKKNQDNYEKFCRIAE